MAESGATVLTNVSSMPTLFDAIQRPSISASTSLNATSPALQSPSSPTTSTTTLSGSTTSPRTSQSASNLPSLSTSRSTLSSFFSSPRGVTIQDPSVQITDEREINLSGRGQTKFPGIQLMGFQKLKKLNLSQNQIREITEQDIRNLVPKPAKSLTLLDLSHNQLNRLPSQISLLLTLRKLYLQHNRLTSIPSEIVGCVHLRSVNLSDNLLESLPCEIAQLYSLKKLQLSGNPLQDPPLAICNRGVKEIFTYFNLKSSSTSFSAGGPKSSSSTDLRKPGRLSLNMSRFSSKHFGSSGNVSLINSPTSSSDSTSNDSETYHFGDESGEVEEFSEKLLLSHFTQLDNYCQSFGFTLYPDDSGDSSNIKDLKKKFKNNRKHQQKAFLSWIQKFLRLPGVYNFNWAEIFHRRLLFTHTILLGRQLVVYRNLIRYFLEGASKDLASISERVKKIYQKLGEDLAGFLETHQQDPDGALIGLQPNENLVRSFLSYVSGGTVTGSSQNLVKFMKPSENEYTREKLVQKILLWSQMSDLEVIGKQVVVFADVLKAADVFNLQKGDLVIAKLNADEGEKILFARLVNMNTASNTAKIVYSPNEKSVSVISTSSLLPVSSELKLRMEDTRSMQKLTHDGIDELYKQLKTEINERLKNFLTEQGVDTHILERAFLEKTSLSEFNKLKTMRVLLQEYVHNPPEEVVEGITKSASQRIKDFLENVDSKPIFVPLKTETLAQLKEWPIDLIAKNRLQHYLGLDQLQIKKREIIDGTKKRQLAAWWLDLIKKRVEQFLEERNFDFNAVCDEYIDVPPVNFESVRSNLQLIREIINSNTSFGDTSSSSTTTSSTTSFGDSHGLQESLINPLMETVYERIDEYLRESFAAISDCLGVEPTPKPFEIEKEWERLQELLKNRDTGSGSVSPTSVSKDKSDWLDALSKDVHYLIDMKRCEAKHQTDRKQQKEAASTTSTSSSPATASPASPTSTSSSPLTPALGPGAGVPNPTTMGNQPSFAITSQRLAMSHVVPVSGLIMSRFYRLENELKTVLDVWFRNQKDEQTPMTSYWT